MQIVALKLHWKQWQ